MGASISAKSVFIYILPSWTNAETLLTSGKLSQVASSFSVMGINCIPYNFLNLSNT
jgi:hypothetical protein